MKGSTLRLCLLTVCCSGLLTASYAAGPGLMFNASALHVGADSASNSFVGKHAGNDMLPYTADDVSVTSTGDFPFNFGGSLGLTHFDQNSDNVVDPTEHAFTWVRVNALAPATTDVGEVHLFSPLSRPEYGAIYESEDWYAVLDATETGPAGAFEVADAAAGDGDFELNDNNGWCDESNAYIYNHLGANQHGQGLAKYAIDYSVGNGLDEMEGYTKSFCFVGVLDDPNTPDFNERGHCRRWFRGRGGPNGSPHVELKGYMIPVGDVAGLATGSLPSLFGWESVDLADYMRDTIGPVLADPALDFGIDSVGYLSDTPAGVALGPLTHVYLRQLSFPIDVSNLDGECSGTDSAVCTPEPDPLTQGTCHVQQYGAYWGFQDGGRDGGTLRESSLMGVNFNLVPLFQLALGCNSLHGVDPSNLPDDGKRQNVWVQDHFWRGESSHLGNYTFEPAQTWTIEDDPFFVAFDCTADAFISAAAGGAITAPIPDGGSLTSAEGPIQIVADIAEDLRAGGGAGGPAIFQVIARNGSNVIAYADITAAAVTVFVGGTYDEATGSASGGTAGAAGLGIAIGEIDPDNAVADYSRVVLTVSSAGVSVRGAEAGDFDVTTFSGLDSLGDELATAGGANLDGDGITAASIFGFPRPAINTVLVLAGAGVGPFFRGDCNGDGAGDISDASFLLNFLFLGGATPGCQAACNSNGDSATDISDASFLLNFLFLGGSAPSAPFGSAAFSQDDGDAAVGCETPQG